jgi:hypothetical protein
MLQLSKTITKGEVKVIKRELSIKYSLYSEPLKLNKEGINFFNHDSIIILLSGIWEISKVLT